MSELRYAVKSMLHAPAFALGAILTFAIGIGVNVAVFSAVDRILFRSLPYDHPERLVVMGRFRPGRAQPDFDMPAKYVVRARQAPGIEELTLSSSSLPTYRFTERSEGAQSFSFVPMTYTALRTLGVRPVVGPDFSEDDARSKRRKVMITHAVWQREFAARSDVVGSAVWGESARGEIAGVLPEDFIPPQTQVSASWSGIVLTGETLDDASSTRDMTPPFIRLRPGVSMAQAQAQIDAIVASVPDESAEKPGVASGVIRLESLREALFGRYVLYVALVFAAATMVLVVACANLASLLLVRGRSREYQAALQLALGAPASRLVRAAVIEALLLAVSGCAVALVLLKLSTNLIVVWLPPLFSKYAAPVFGTRVLLFSAAVATASAMVAGVLPGWRASKVDVLLVLQRGTSRTGLGRLRGSGALLAVEVALSTLLIACAVLTGRTVLNLQGMNVGFKPDRLLILAANLPSTKDKALLLHQYEELLATIRSTPGVESAAGADMLPMIGDINRPMFKGSRIGQRCPVTDGLIETLGMRVIAGRTITAEDVRTDAQVGMLSLDGLEVVWPGVTPEQALGRFLHFPDEPARQVIGIVSDVRYPYTAPTFPYLYVPTAPSNLNSMLFAVRPSPGVTLTTADFTVQFRRAGNAPTFVNAVSVANKFASTIVDQKFRAQLFSGFGFVAIVLAVIGVYAVQASTVALRRMEFGIRVALGARPSDLWRLLILDTIRPAVAGVLLGLVMTFWASQLLQAFLYGVTGRDPWTFAGVALLLVAIAAAAVWVPARQASRTDPASVLRAP